MFDLIYLSDINCIDGSGENYKGTLAKTKDGKDCLNWDSYPWWGVKGHNYCRLGIKNGHKFL